MKLLIRPALICDLDGTIRETISGQPFIDHPRDLKLIEGVAEQLDRFYKAGYVIYGATNQGGVAYGYKTLELAKEENQKTMDLIKEALGYQPVTKMFFCPFMLKGTISEFSFRSLLRKPEIGMLAVCEMDALLSGVVIDWNTSIMVGDREEDEYCADNAKIRFIHAKDFKDEKV